VESSRPIERRIFPISIPEISLVISRFEVDDGPLKGSTEGIKLINHLLMVLNLFDQPVSFRFIRKCLHLRSISFEFTYQNFSLI
jgi:hypothetical protein